MIQEIIRDSSHVPSYKRGILKIFGIIRFTGDICVIRIIGATVGMVENACDYFGKTAIAQVVIVANAVDTRRVCQSCSHVFRCHVFHTASVTP